MSGSPPASFVHGILQARIMEWIVIPFSRRSFQPRDQTCISCIGRQILYYWATMEAHIGVQPINNIVIVLGEQQSNSAIHIHNIQSPPELPSRMPHNTEQSSLYYTVRSLLANHFEYSSVYISIPNSLTIPSPQQPTVSSFSKSVSVFYKFLCIISF